jgi:hypothetical protein
VTLVTHKVSQVAGAVEFESQLPLVRRQAAGLESLVVGQGVMAAVEQTVVRHNVVLLRSSVPERQSGERGCGIPDQGPEHREGVGVAWQGAESAVGSSVLPFWVGLNTYFL